MGIKLSSDVIREINKEEIKVTITKESIILQKIVGGQTLKSECKFLHDETSFLSYDSALSLTLEQLFTRFKNGYNI